MIRCLGCMEEYEDHMTACPHCGYQAGEGPKEAYYLVPGTVLNGQYLVGKVLGYGGFGVTYIGWDMTLKRKAAIKEYLPSDFATRVLGCKNVTVFSQDAAEQFCAGLESFIAEARKLAKFNNIPEIVDIYDCFLENNTGYIVMEFLYGQTVKELLTEGKAFPYPTALSIIKAILTGLAHVHKEGIIHRDIAPDNIFITTMDEIRLLDFGAARYAVSTHSRSLSVILKPGYAPEEQYRSKGEQGPWTDVYGAGATLYRMLTGIRPQESIERRADDQLKPPSALGIELPLNVENALMNALNVEKEYRFQSAEEFLSALDSDQVRRIVPKTAAEAHVRTPRWVKGVMIGCFFLTVGAILLLGKREFSGLSKAEEVQERLPEGQEYVPDMTGLSYEEAKNRLGSAMSLLIGGKNYSTTVEYNKIVSQTPSAGEVVQVGDVVQVIMSGGTREVTMPDLESLSEEEAAAALNAQGLVLDKKAIDSDFNDFVEKGRVYFQSVESGQKVTPGSTVSFSISLGQLAKETALVTVPDLSGKTKKEAAAVLEALKAEKGFTFPLGSIDKKYNAEVPKGKILSQSLKAGSIVRTNEAIDLVISKGPRMVEMPDVVYMEKDEAVKTLEALKIKVTVETIYSAAVKSGSVVSQSVDAGKETAEGSTVIIRVSKGAEPVLQSPASSNPVPQTNPPTQDNPPSGWIVDDDDGGGWIIE